MKLRNKRIVNGLLAVMFMVFVMGNMQMQQVNAEEDSIVSGSFGPNFTWTLDKENGEFKLNGSGNTPSLERVDAPWKEYVQEIKKVYFSSDIEMIGANFFRGMEGLEEFHVPSIEDYLKMDMSEFNSTPLEYAENLYIGGELVKDVMIPDGITEIKENAFYNCDSLETIIIPDSVEVLGKYAFYDCDNLKEIAIPSKVLSVYESCFRSCDLLSKVTFEHDENNISRLSSIGFNTFKDTPLKELEFPANLCYISYGSIPSALEKMVIYNPRCTIDAECGATFYTTVYGFKGSTAEEFANTISTSFADIEAEHEHVYKDTVMLGYCVRKRCICGQEELTEHVDADKDVICDVCHRTTNDLSLTETKNVVLHDQEKLYLSYTAAKNGKYTFEITNLNGFNEFHLYKSDKEWDFTNIYTLEESATLSCKIEKGEQVYLCIVNDSGCNSMDITLKYEPVQDTHVHQYETVYTVDKKATLTANGTKSKHCKGCDARTSITTIYKASNVKLATSAFVYNGKMRSPSIVVKDSKGNKIASSNYTITKPSGRKNVGKYTYTIKFKNQYSGTKKLTFKINPKGTSLSSVTAAKKAFTVKWKKQSTKMATSRITGYQIQYSTSKKFTSPKTVTVSGYSNTSKKITKLSAKKTYYVRIRTYITVNGTKYYSGWSTVKSVKTK